MSVKLSLDLGEVTFGDLYAFVDVARAAGISPDQVVTEVPLDQDPSVVDRLEVEVPFDSISPEAAPLVIGPDLRMRLREVLREVAFNEGDARSVIDEAKDLLGTV